jgi:hypothetical protein
VRSRERLALSVHFSVLQSKNHYQGSSPLRNARCGSDGAGSCCLKPGTRTLFEANAGVTQLVEYLPSKQAVASSSLVPRSKKSSQWSRFR